MTTNPITPTERVLKQIEAGALRMRPRIYFTVRFIAVISCALLALLLSSLVGSFILFSLEEGGEEFLLGFGVRGIMTFLALFPWLLLLIDIGVILALRFLVQGLRPVYRFSFASVLTVLVGTSFALALLINLTPLHSALLERATIEDVPFIDGLYEDILMPDEARGEFRGTITTIDGRTIIIEHDDFDHDADDGVRTITLPEPIDISAFEIGDEVYVAGDDDDADDVIKAYGAHKLPPGNDDEEDEEEDDSETEEETD